MLMIVKESIPIRNNFTHVSLLGVADLLELITVSNNQIRGYSRPIIYWGVYDFPVLIFSAHSPSFLISCTRLFAYNNNFLSPSLWYIRLLITRIIEWQA